MQRCPLGVSIGACSSTCCKSTLPTSPTTPRPNHGPLLRIRQTPTHLSVTQGYLVLRDEGRDSLISPSFPIDLAAWGVPRLPNDYTILTLNRQTLILKDDHHTLTFRRF